MYKLLGFLSYLIECSHRYNEECGGVLASIDEMGMTSLRVTETSKALKESNGGGDNGDEGSNAGRRHAHVLARCNVHIAPCE